MTSSGQGDPRVTGNRAAVQKAALEVLSADGAAGLTVDRLAQASGVSRSTIYRHWPDLQTLVAAAFEEIMHGSRSSRTNPVHDPSAALLEYLRDYARRLNDPTYATVLVTIIEWSWRDPKFARAQARTFDDTRSRVRSILQAGRAAGAFASSVSLDDAVEAVVAPFLYQRLVLRRVISERQIRAVHRRLLAHV